MDKKATVFADLIQKAGTTREKLFLSAVYLFSTKGYDRVGIRELCALVGIKEASFYNHFPSKESLLAEISSHYLEGNQRTVLDDGEIQQAVSAGDLGQFFDWMMRRFGSITDNPVFHAVLQIIRMESFTNRELGQVALKSLYYFRRDSTVQALRALQAMGRVRDVDLEAAVASYYYGLIGILEEYVLVELWGGDREAMMAKIGRHMKLFIDYLKV
jgi:AcrR family transcriptional regulator